MSMKEDQERRSTETRQLNDEIKAKERIEEDKEEDE